MYSNQSIAESREALLPVNVCIVEENHVVVSEDLQDSLKRILFVPFSMSVVLV